MSLKDCYIEFEFASQQPFEMLQSVCIALREARLKEDFIEFAVYSYPYGGAGCIKALIESFGFKITDEDI